MNILQVNESDPKKSSSKLYRNFLNEIANDETNINIEIFNECFKHQNSSCFVKDSCNGDTKIYEKIVNNVNDSLIDL